MNISKTTSIDNFFEQLKDLLCDGDRLEVKYECDADGNPDYENLVYSIYNFCNDCIGEFFSSKNEYVAY